MAELPSGTVTFLFTDIEGSTRLLKQLGRARYGELLAEQQRLLRQTFAAHRGEEIDSQGDSFFVAFRSAADALSAAVAIQRALAAHDWPDGAEPQVRIGIHSGEAAAAGERYVGVSVHRAARIGAAAHGGQILLSDATRALVEDDLPEGVSLRDLGRVQLKDIDRPERISQLAAAGLRLEFPPLRGAAPVAPSPLLRRRSLALAALAGVVAAAVAIPLFFLGSGSSGAAALAGVEGNALGAIDLASGRVLHSIGVGTSPSAVAVGKDAVWVVNEGDDSVSRIDPNTNASTQTIPVGNGPGGIAVGGGSVWAANSLDGTVSKIDPDANGGSGSEVERIPVGNGPAGVAFGAGGVWVANSSDRTVVRIDPRSGAVGRPIPVDAGADAIAVGEGGVWVTSESAGSVARIDPATGSVIQTINVGSGPTAVAVGAGAVWVANSIDDTVSRIDPGANKVSATIQVGAGPSGVAVTPDAKAVWVSNELGGTLSGIDPARNKVVQTVPTGNRPRGVAVGANALYVAVRSSGLAHRGGTLTVAEFGKIPPEADSIDWSRGYVSWELLIPTNDGLTAFKRVGGSESSRLVADLATSLPIATNGGRTYTFQLRPGIRYSTGAPVRPADFRRAIERALLNSVRGTGLPPGYFADIVGADVCLNAKSKRCDLSTGIVADAAANTVTFHLTAPDPEFLYKLSLPTMDAVPAGTPLEARLPLPATGPYRVASYDAKHGLIRLVRNHRFHEWSAAAQPDGFPDAIVERFGYSYDGALRSVERGAADLTQLGGPQHPARLLQTGYARQLHVNPNLATRWLSLNTRLPPFSDLRVRQAVNYAVDRNRLSVLNEGSDHPTCQVLPPNMLGYRRYCPYTIDPSADGKYTGPDLAEARKLVAASGTKGQAVTVWAWKEDPGARYLVSVLRSLGYKAHLKAVKGAFSTFAAEIGDSRRKIQAASNGWGADYPSPSSFFAPLFTCASFQPRTGGNQNVPEFCNRRIDAEIARAQALQTSDVQTASYLWSKIDRDIVDQAPVVAAFNPLNQDLVSRRVSNYQYNVQTGGALLDQLWVR